MAPEGGFSVAIVSTLVKAGAITRIEGARINDFLEFGSSASFTAGEGGTGDTGTVITTPPSLKPVTVQFDRASANSIGGCK